MNTPRVDVAVVVVAHNSADVVGDLLDGLPDALGGLRADVVVVDNGSRDDTADRVEARGDCRVIRSTNTGYAGGLNTGAATTPPCVPLLVLNPDARLAPGSVRVLLDALALPHTAVVAPRVTAPDGTLERSLRREPTLWRAIGLARTRLPLLSEYVDDPAQYDRPQVVDWALGAVLLVSRDAFDSLNGWDASYFLYSEETDFSLRAADAGWLTRYAPAARAVHIGGASGRDDATHTMQIVNRVRLYRRRHTAAAAAAYWFLTIVSEASWYMRGHRQSRSALRALVRPSVRPEALGAGDRLIPA